MVRTLIGVSVFALALAACATSMESAAAPPSAQAAKAAVKLEDKFATSQDGTKIHYVASARGR